MDILHRNKYVCEYDHGKFQNYEEFIVHTKHVHHPVVKCRECGKEFIHEKDRLHYVREQHEQKLDYGTHKDS
jgi:hypothetical protein